MPMFLKIVQQYITDPRTDWILHRVLEELAAFIMKSKDKAVANNFYTLFLAPFVEILYPSSADVFFLRLPVVSSCIYMFRCAMFSLEEPLLQKWVEKNEGLLARHIMTANILASFFLLVP